jgi:hypothetical protein
MVLADGAITNVLIQIGIAREANPFLAGIAGESKLIIFKTAGVLLVILIFWDIRRYYPRLAFWTASSFLLIYCGIVLWNLNLLLTGL